MLRPWRWRGAEISKSLLQGMKCRALSHAFDALNVASFGIQTQHQARKNCASINQHRTSAALSQFATMFGSGQIQIFTQDFQKSLVRRKHNFGAFTVKSETDVRFLFYFG